MPFQGSRDPTITDHPLCRSGPRSFGDGIWKFCCHKPKEFITFLTLKFKVSKDICHLVLTPGAILRNRCSFFGSLLVVVCFACFFPLPVGCFYLRTRRPPTDRQLSVLLKLEKGGRKVPKSYFLSLFSGGVPANQTEESEVHELLGKKSGTGSEPPFAGKYFSKALKEGVAELIPNSFPESSRTSLSLVWFAGATLYFPPIFVESPQMWVWPQRPFGGHPPPKATGGPFPPARALPSPPSLSSPTILALLAMLRDGRPGWRGGGGSRRWSGRVLQTALAQRTLPY